MRRPDFTYFVDGAIYGFAVGSAFGMLENLLYVSRVGTTSGLALALTRAFSTSLMHGSASALVGVALGRLRFGRGLTRLIAVVLGWAAAITLHIAFNNLISQRWGILTVLLAVLVGVGGVVLNAGFIRWGLHEERRWLRDTLGRETGVSAGESAVVQQLATLNRLLAPVSERFGLEKRQQVETFLRLQAQLGLKRKVEEMTPDLRLRSEMAAQVAALRLEVDELRRAIGVYCMTYVRSILPPETEPLWSRLNATLAKPALPPSGINLWHNLGSKIGDQADQ
ncbi:MAG: PrsW family glutamic-type intramembrane protease [Chloroflexi bacterium]|nr:PrsW family glutamic-type intramembrane protease [Chloroflexota bacterium]